jgi:septum formation protein
VISTQQASLILASSSPRRQELIRALNLPFSIQASDVDETITEVLSPVQIVETLSLRKAKVIADQVKSSQVQQNVIVVGSDTIVVFRDEVLGKPKDASDAARMLTMLQGNVHEVYSGVALIQIGSGETKVQHRQTKVKMKPLNAKQIANYIATGEPNDKAGAYAIQGIGATIVESIEGDYFNVVGLPLSLLSDMLSDMGVEVL